MPTFPARSPKNPYLSSAKFTNPYLSSEKPANPYLSSEKPANPYDEEDVEYGRTNNCPDANVSLCNENTWKYTHDGI